MHSTTSPSPRTAKHDRDHSLPLDSSSPLISPFPALKNAEDNDPDDTQEEDDNKSGNSSPSSKMMSPITAMKLLTASIQYMEEPIVPYATPPPHHHQQNEEEDSSTQMMFSLSSNETAVEDKNDPEEEGPVGLAATTSDSLGGSEEEEEDDEFTTLREESYFSNLRRKRVPPTTTPGDPKPHHHKRSLVPSSGTPSFTSPITTTSQNKRKQQQQQLKEPPVVPKGYTPVVSSLFASPIEVDCRSSINKKEEEEDHHHREEEQPQREEGPSLMSFPFLSPILPQAAGKPPSPLETSTLFLSPIAASNHFLDTTKASNVGGLDNHNHNPDSSTGSSPASATTGSLEDREEETSSEGGVVQQPRNHESNSSCCSSGKDDPQPPNQPEEEAKSATSPSHVSAVTTLVEDLDHQEDEEEEVGYHFVDVDVEASCYDMIVEECHQPPPPPLLSLSLSPGDVLEGLDDGDGEGKDSRDRCRFLDAMELQYDIEEGRPVPPPPPPRRFSTAAATLPDPVFEFASTIASGRSSASINIRDNKRITLVWACILLLVGALASGGISLFVSGIGDREGEIKFVYHQPGNSEGDDDDDYYPLSSNSRNNYNYGGGGGEDDPLLLPTRNMTFSDDDHFGWDCKDAAYQEYFLRKVVRRVVSDREALRTPGSPQHKALEWLVETDGPALCPSYFWDEDHTSLIQRYVLAVFYFSTRGRDWHKCSAPDYFASEHNVANANSRCQPLQSYYGRQEDVVVSRTSKTNSSRGSDVTALAWLTSAPECHWGGVSCDGFGRIIELDIGKSTLHHGTVR